ncbi:hypothetical protein BJV78DRAFT_1170407 [Lactifluus subvellereus]|nr:hypothetical protein BJV78DRAFT_1170407 [Lactifluus subvellereus]
MIKNSWYSLTRRIDGDVPEIICADPKNCTGHIHPPNISSTSRARHGRISSKGRL